MQRKCLLHNTAPSFQRADQVFQIYTIYYNLNQFKFLDATPLSSVIYHTVKHKNKSVMHTEARKTRNLDKMKYKFQYSIFQNYNPQELSAHKILTARNTHETIAKQQNSSCFS